MVSTAGFNRKSPSSIFGRAQVQAAVFVDNLFIYSFIYLVIYSLFKVDKFTIKTNTILYTNKNSDAVIIKIKTC